MSKLSPTFLYTGIGDRVKTIIKYFIYNIVMYIFVQSCVKLTSIKEHCRDGDTNTNDSSSITNICNTISTSNKTYILYT